ncbi:uncharacterized protein LOC101854634 [Aplysia californica]|uniref:Uncharacterized protein LOC101854634 n=1 Tax=Aplysia californica TaxID=6500 RepID=A0ABM1VSE6_APLCA|nr:uncharacterized protein LOC101854634 [Aplysia californica]
MNASSTRNTVIPSKFLTGVGSSYRMCCENITACMMVQRMWPLNLTGVQRRLRARDMSTYSTVVCLQIYAIPFLVLLGIFLSTFTCVVLLRTRLRKKFYSHFLVGVSVCSQGFLLTVMVNWMFNQGVPVFGVAGVCQMTIFCSHFFPFLVFWLSVVGAMMILLDLTRLRTYKWMNSPGAAKSWVIGLSLLAFTVYSYKTWTHGVFRYRDRDMCIVFPENEAVMEVLNVIDLMLLLYLPSFSFLFFDVALVFWICCRASKVTWKWVYKQEPGTDDLTVNQALQILFYLFFVVNPIFPFCVSRKFRRNVSVLISHGCSKNIAMRYLRPASPTL